MKKRLREQADFDQAQYKPGRLDTFDKQEFSDRGRADLKIRPNDPRFADNPMYDEQLDEFLDTASDIDRLHDMLAHAGITDQQIKGGIELSHSGMQKVAARFGIEPDEVSMYLNTLTQALKNEDETTLVNSLEEEYWNRSM
jgi:hypothetical protein